ncbi:MAG TPA: DUF3500 domain-containing protein [Chitinophagaceae bacterium]|nr:DUF3500 domain-containing protein [Chitinophagaceae bacterium]
MFRNVLLLFTVLACQQLASAQDLVQKANSFIQLLTDAQKAKALYPFDTAERYRFMYVPLEDRKGISMNELNSAQRAAVIALLSTSISKETVQKVQAIMQLDDVLKAIENRKPEDHYRDPGKYFITVFGTPSANSIWGWRFEGHHVAFHFSADKQTLVAGTPSFLGANPAIVQNGPHKDEQVLKEETAKGFALLHALSASERKLAIIDSIAPGEIITAASRKASIAQPAGIRYSQLSAANQQLLWQLVELYIHRYTKLFASAMLQQIKTAGLDNLWFTWAGATEHAIGKPQYYRIQGPTLIIEYDNSQNNANHVHTVVRDLTNDFGGDLLLEHYKQSHQ